MDTVAFEALTRRASLLTLSVAGFAAALGGPLATEGKKKGGKHKKKDEKKRCQNPCPAQVEPCTAFLTEACGPNPECEGQISCCAFLGTCDTNGFFTCLANAAPRRPVAVAG